MNPLDLFDALWNFHGSILQNDPRYRSIDSWRDHARSNPYSAFLGLRDLPVRSHADMLSLLDDATRAKVTALLSSDSIDGDAL